MITAHGAIDPATAVGPVPARLFGVLVEHMGRCVYDGIFAPGDPAADATGVRTDVLELAREYGTTVVRYPGGNFVSGYDWQDGIGSERIRTPGSRVALDRAEHLRLARGRWAGSTSVGPSR